MKEASGEANLTVVAIILIGVIAAVVTPIIRSMMGNTAKRACCMDAGGTWKSSGCVRIDAAGTETNIDSELQDCYEGDES